jgi:B12-binding domain/radical SAM domain protein
MSQNAKFIFLKNRFNKFSIRALITSFEKFFPTLNYLLLDEDESLYKLTFSDEVLFFSFNTINAIKSIEMAKNLKSKFNQITTVCGGAHPSAKKESLLNMFDCVCVNEGEYILKEIVELYLSEKKVSGIFENKKIVNLDDFDTYPKKVKMFGAIEIMRGCQFKCAYCQTPMLFSKGLRCRSIENILHGVSYSFSHGKKDYRFITPDAASYMYKNGVNIDAIYNLLSGIKKVTDNKGRIFFGSFPSEINPYFVNEDLVKVLKEFCSNKRVVIGLQSASPLQLRKMNRSPNISKIEETIELFLKYNFIVDVDFIFGLPYETEESIEETFSWILKWINRVRIHSHYFMPLPGSLWENEMPTEIPEKFVKLISQLEGKGKLFGQWNIQSKFSNYLTKKELVT